MTLSARQLYFEAVKIGDELPPLVKPPVDRLQIARYAGAAQDWSPLSVDEPFARNSGFPSALAPAMISMGFLAELAVEWVRGARLRRFQARFVKIVWPGDVLTARGRVIDRRFEEGGRYAIDIEVWAENQRGELVVRGLAVFQLFYSAEDEARQRGGQPPLAVTREEEEARLARLSRAQPPRPAVTAGRPLAPPRPLAQPPRPAAPGPPSARPSPPPPARPAAAAAPARTPLPGARPVAAAAPRAPAPPASATSTAVAKPAAQPPAPPRGAARPVATPPAPPRGAARPTAPSPSAPPRAAARPPPASPARAHPARPAPQPRTAVRAGAAPAAAKPGTAKPAPRAAAKAKAPARPAPGRAGAGKSKAARPHPAKRPVRKEKAAGGRARAPARKAPGKKRR
jgi:acyl dehydratase